MIPELFITGLVVIILLAGFSLNLKKFLEQSGRE